MILEKGCTNERTKREKNVSMGSRDGSAGIGKCENEEEEFEETEQAWKCV